MRPTLLLLVTAIVTASCLNLVLCDDDVYDIGIGMADITGPVADIQFWGYATMHQAGGGVHTRLFSRAFIISDGVSRVVLVTAELGSISQLVRTQVIRQLRKKYGDLYTENNVCISATHTHSGPGGYHQYVLYSIAAMGFIEESFFAIVDGIVQSVVVAHNNTKKGHLYWNQGVLLHANYNRSPTAYLNNPAEERSQYSDDVDKMMYLLKMTDLAGESIGMINWYPVHGTSMNNTNKLVSSDNKGYAAIKFEEAKNGKSLIGEGPFVSAFAQSNHGDTSPNVEGPRCLDTGAKCEVNTSTCHGKSTLCVAFGPGKNMFESTRIIGTLQLQKAGELFRTATKKIRGKVQFIHQHLDMTNVQVTEATGKTVVTCKPAMGYSFAAGTTDGPGRSEFEQSTTSSNPFWNFVRNFIRTPSAAQKTCHLPKPILLDTGEMAFPYPWQPAILPTQVIKIGNLIILPVPAEFATMPGRRLANAVRNVTDSVKPENDLHIVVQSLSNAYSSYVTTYEEYQAQRYEGASTTYGPHTLEAYILQYRMLMNNLLLQLNISQGPDPPYLLKRQLKLKPDVLYDGAGFGKTFGQVVRDVAQQYNIGETVTVSFVSGHPRNSVERSHIFLSVDHYNETTKQWNAVATDANWETKFYWQRINSLMGESRVTVTWDIPEHTLPGTYRIQHFGYHKNLLRGIRPYSGKSSSFTVVSNHI